MPATHDTREIFPVVDYLEPDIQEEVQLRLKMGAITSRYSKNGDNWELVTTWNVLGQQ